jgi:hypothetical protein
MNKQLRDNILEQIAISFPFSVNDVFTVYSVTSPIDATIKICEAAVKLGLSSPIYITDVAKNGLPEPVKTPLFPGLK